jgi:hypothetical protein
MAEEGSYHRPMADDTDAKLDEIIRLLGGVIDQLQQIEGSDHSPLIYNELGNIRDSVGRIEEMIERQVSG